MYLCRRRVIRAAVCLIAILWGCFAVHGPARAQTLNHLPPDLKTYIGEALQANPEIKRLADLHINKTDYVTEAHGVPSPDGRKALWASNWDAPTGRPIPKSAGDVDDLKYQAPQSLSETAHSGEMMTVKIIKEGKEPNQGVGYLDDGTMVVVDNAKRLIGKTVDIVVTSVLQTTAGKMFFGRFENPQGAQPEEVDRIRRNG